MEVVNVVVHYGAGTVRTSESGVDLSEFGNVEIQLTEPEKVKISGVQWYFTVNFGYDPNYWTVRIQSVWTKSRSNIRWELLPLDRTNQWVSWLASCKRRGTKPEVLVSFVLKQNNFEIGGGAVQTGETSEATSSHCAQMPGHYEPSPSAGHAQIPVGYVPSLSEIPLHYEPALSAGPAQIGEADADEHEGTVQAEILVEDEDGVAEDIDSDDSDENNDEDVPIPSYWNQDNSAITAVPDVHESSWEYHMNNIQIGAQYSTKQQLREAVIQWALSTQRVFRTDVSNRQYLTMSCVDIGCPSRVHGHLPKYDVVWVVTDVVPHTCEINSLLTDHPNLTSTLIARLLFSEIVSKKDMEAKHIISTVQARWNTTIKYGKACRAK